MRFAQVYNSNTGLRVHAAGCADVTRDLRKYRHSEVFEAECDSAEVAVADFYSDFIEEGSMTAEESLSYAVILPCTRTIVREG